MTDYNVTKFCDQLWGKIDTKLPGSKGMMCPPANTIPDSCSFIKEFALQPKIDDGSISQGIADTIYELCPDVVTTCCGDTNTLSKDTAINVARIIQSSLCRGDKNGSCAYVKEHILNGLVTSGKIPKNLLDVFDKFCPEVIQSVCDQKISPEISKAIIKIVTQYGDDITKYIIDLINDQDNCDIIGIMFHKLVTNERLLDMIQGKIGSNINIRNYQVCDIVQIISSMGVDIVGIFMYILNSKLASLNIILTAVNYERIISCICPQYTEKKIKCDKVVLLVKNIISEPAFQALVENKGKVIKTTNDICVSLQKIVDDGNDPAEIIYNYLLNMMPPTPDPTPPVYQCDSSNCFTPMICENNTCITPTPPPIDPCEACKNAAPCFSPDGCNNRYTNNGKWAGVYIGCEEKGASACAPSCYPSCIDPIPTPPVSQCDSTNCFPPDSCNNNECIKFIPPVYQCDSSNCPPPDSCNNNECIKFMPPVYQCDSTNCFPPDSCNNNECIKFIPPEVDSFNTCNTDSKKDKCKKGAEGSDPFSFRDKCLTDDACSHRDADGKWQGYQPSPSWAWSYRHYETCNQGAACESCYPPGCGGSKMQMRMRGLDPKYLLYIPTKEKIHEAIMCICPNLKQKPKSESVLNKLNVGLLVAGGSVFTIILYVILFFFVIKLLSTGLKILVFCGLAVATIIIIGLIIQMNPKCLFKSCSGDDWTYIPGTFQGEKTLGSSITIKAQITIDKNKTITLQQLDCAGDKCPFTTLPLACQANNLITLGEKTANGYNILGDCVDSLKNKTVKNITLLQENGNISIMLMVSSGVGDVNVKIPMIKKSVEPYYVYQTERQRNITNDCLPSKDGVY